MTVQELIDRLNRIPNKSLPVGRYIDGDSGGPDSLLLYNGVEIEDKKIYLHNAKKMNTYGIIEFVTLTTGGLY